MSEHVSNLKSSQISASFTCNIYNAKDFCEIQRRFDEIIAELPAYGHTLARIKASYETVMTKIESSKRVNSVIQLEGSQRRLQEKTLSNFLSYQQQLEAELSQLRNDNEALKKSIENHKEMQSQLDLRAQQELEMSRSKTSMNSERRKKLNLTVEQATDVLFLDKELKRVEQELEDIKIGTEKRHVPFSKKTNLQIQLQDKEKEKIKLERENKYLGCLFFQLSVALKSAATVQSARDAQKQIRCTMVEKILDIINGIDDEKIQRKVEGMNEEDKDEEKEAEFILYCTERFHELFDKEQYKEAALLAATSPMGFLRTVDTLEKFKAVSVSSHDHTHSDTPTETPLFLYCTTIMHSAVLYNTVTYNEATEITKCALECRQYEKIMNWMANRCLPITKDIGMMIFQNCSCTTRCTCLCIEIAFLVFDSLDQYNEAALCLAKLGMYNRLLKFIEDKRLQRNDVVSLLYSYPNTELAISLTCPSPPELPQCHILEAVFILSQLKQYSICTNVLKTFSCHHSVDMSEVLDDASKNPAYQELTGQLIDLLAGTELDWIAVELVANRVVQKALENAFNEMQQTCTKSDIHSSTQTSTLYDEELSGMTGSDHEGMSSRPTLVRSGHIDLSDSDDVAASDVSSTCDSSTSGSYLSEL